MTITTPPVTPPRRSRLGLAAVAVGCVLMAAMWGYYLFVADDTGIYQLQDRTWRAQAAGICEQATLDRLQLVDTSQGFITEPTIDQMRQRADLVDRATDVLEQMVDDITAIPVDNDRDREILGVFEENYRLVIGDRRRYAERLRSGDASPFNETVVAGGPVSNVVTDFTAGVKGNAVQACSPPYDLPNTRQP
jgi:hypothetical protein